MGEIRVRFAPSPTGHLHLGSARTALFNWLFARHNGGKMILRIEDTDPERSQPEYETSIMEDLRWLGLDWDEGPDVEGPFAPYRQSQRSQLYMEHARRLVEKGMAYFCYCTPEELEEKKKRALAEGKMPLYDGKCRNLGAKDRRSLEAEGKKPALRFRVPEGAIEFNDLLHGKVLFSSQVIGDFIILRSDGTAGFNFSVVVDDATMQITHVIRGEDHLTNTARHILLFRALDYTPPTFAHHSLLLGADGSKMSKRHGATAVREYRESGYLPEALVNYLALLSWSPDQGESEVLGLDELKERFRLKTLSRSPAIFDLGKLNWLNGQHIRRIDLDRLIELARPFAGPLANHPSFREMIVSIRDNLDLLTEVPHYLEVFFTTPEVTPAIREALMSRESLEVVERAIRLLEQSQVADAEQSRIFLHELSESLQEKGLKPREIFMPLRLLLTGRSSGPALTHVFAILGKEESMRRLREGLDQL
jgi:glutamyl-tRNA synthetase